MDCRIELIFVPVTDVDEAIEFYVDKVGFTLDMQARVTDEVRFVQVTPPTSACSIAFGTGISDMVPGTQDGIQVVVPDAEAARESSCPTASTRPRSRCWSGARSRRSATPTATPGPSNSFWPGRAEPRESGRAAAVRSALHA